MDQHRENLADVPFLVNQVSGGPLVRFRLRPIDIGNDVKIRRRFESVQDLGM